MASGDQKPWLPDEEKYKEVCKGWREILKNHPATGEAMPNYGTAGFVNLCNASYTMPTRNFQQGQYKEIDAVSGETLAETELVKNYACFGCVIACGRRVEVDGKNVKGPEYETLGLFGPTSPTPISRPSCAGTTSVTCWAWTPSAWATSSAS